MTITEITRDALFKELKGLPLYWWGNMSELDFLKRLCNLTEMPSTDKRFPDAEGDIRQHRVNNLDWDDYWIFYDERFNLQRNDKLLLEFLAATVHPLVCPDREQAQALVKIYNRHLSFDGWELAEVYQESGRFIYGPRELTATPSALRRLSTIAKANDFEYLNTQIARMEASIESDPELAIGTAKELVETVCKTILQSFDVVPEGSWTLTKLVKETSNALKITTADVADDAPAAETVRKILGSLSGIVDGLGELRNAYGTGHGKPLGAGGLRARHASLAVGAASTLALFLFDTFKHKQQR